MQRSKNLIDIVDLSTRDIRQIWHLAEREPLALSGTVGCSFEGNGIRTRTSFLQAFQSLGLSCIELPNLLKGVERVRDLAGYLDAFYSMYVVRESDHERLSAFAEASSRPVINAMSGRGHPCEVLTDAYYIEREIGPLESVTIGVWGPSTNVLRSWGELAQVFDTPIYQFCDPDAYMGGERVHLRTAPDVTVDILITDGWPGGFDNAAWSLTEAHLASLGNPRLLPTPPFSIGRELAFDPLHYERFVGYSQKRLLLDVQRAIVMYVATHSSPAGT